MAETHNPDTIVWFENRFVRLADANVNILTHALNYGTGVFEGIRGYYDDEQNELFLLRPHDHYERWKRNCGLIRIEVPKSAQELTEITAELCRRNDFRTGIYVRPLAYKASPRIRVWPDDNDACAIIAVPLGPVADTSKGLKAGVSSWRRVDDNMIPGRGKICGAYVNSTLAVEDAKRSGHDEAILLTQEGHVAEGATCNVFIVRNGKLITPPVTDNILEGITRDSVMEIGRDLGFEVVERSVDRSELYVADEVFFVGTAIEIAPIVSVDHRPVRSGQVGEITERIRTTYNQAARGRVERYRKWVVPAHQAVAV